MSQCPVCLDKFRCKYVHYWLGFYKSECYLGYILSDGICVQQANIPKCRYSELQKIARLLLVKSQLLLHGYPMARHVGCIPGY